MKTNLLLRLTVGLLFVQIFNLQAQSFKLKTYKVTVKGTSTLHEWESVVEKVDAKGFYALENNELVDVKDVVIKIPVTSIKSTKGKIMDNKTYEAFSYEKFPHIIFTLNTKKINGANSTISVTGKLSMGGATNQIDLNLNYKLLPYGELQLTGSKKLLMTDFKMQPPTAMMGTIKVGNEVIVTFDITLTSNNTIL
jgi:polyisoprenoid-binding protein YceI